MVKRFRRLHRHTICSLVLSPRLLCRRLRPTLYCPLKPRPWPLNKFQHHPRPNQPANQPRHNPDSQRILFVRSHPILLKLIVPSQMPAVTTPECTHNDA